MAPVVPALSNDGGIVIPARNTLRAPNNSLTDSAIRERTRCEESYSPRESVPQRNCTLKAERSATVVIKFHDTNLRDSL